VARFLVPQRTAVIRRRCPLEALLPEGHLARFVWRTLHALDFSALELLYATTNGGPGRSPYHPRVLAALWIYGMSQGLETASAIAAACTLRDDFRWLSGGLRPSDQTLLNLLDHAEELVDIWKQVLRAMHREGHVDLSVIAEDGSKVHANASPRSFRTAEEIDVVVNDLRAKLAQKVEQAGAGDASKPDRKDRAQLVALRDRLHRAERAAQELRERAERRAGGARGQESNASATPAAEDVPERFRRTDFRYDAAQNVLICPGDQTLRLVGTYTDDRGRSAYRLYARRDCSDCALKAQCTSGTGRRVKVPVVLEPQPLSVTPLETTEVPPSSAPRDDADKPSTPRGSLTDPEALMMLATSEKRWQPSYNADIAVERHGIIVSQFLTKRPTDFHSFAPALHTVVSTLGRPESWIGDGHYGTHANLLLADEHGVVLYASPEGDSSPATTAAPADPPSPQPGALPQASKHSHRAEFRHDPERNVVICPANQELRFVGRYSTANGYGTYRLYARRDCSACSRKPDCTTATGRRFKLADAPPSPAGAEQQAAGAAQHLAELIRARDERMQHQGEAVMRFRRSTVEPAHAHLKQHGLGRLHVRGRLRGSAVLTLCCTSHNIMKWRARENARALRLAA
jgi:transposase